MYAGGADTVVSTMKPFILSMVKLPDIQRKAQEEIDRVIGVAQLPGFKNNYISCHTYGTWSEKSFGGLLSSVLIFTAKYIFLIKELFNY